MISVSIIIPVYGVEKHIERCLRSVFRQDYEGDIECVLVDDCSPDKSMEIAENLISVYKGKIRFKKLRHEQNRGLSAARNSGTSVAEGDYLFYLDSDDEIMPSAISSLVDLENKYPGVDVVYGDWYVCKRHNVLQNNPRLREYIDTPDEIIPILVSDGFVSMTAPNKLLRTKFIVQNGLYFKDNTYHEDELFNYFLAEAAGSIAVSFVPTYVYYLNPAGITSGTYDDKRLKDLLDIAEEIFLKGKTLYRYLACLRLLCIICRGMSDLSHLPRLKEFIRLLYMSSFSDGFYRYSFYLYKCYHASFKHLYRMTRRHRYEKIYSDSLKKIQKTSVRRTLLQK